MSAGPFVGESVKQIALRERKISSAARGTTFFPVMHDSAWNQVKSLRTVTPLSNRIVSHWLMKQIF